MAIELTESTRGELRISTITIDNPPVNVLDREHCLELTSCLHQIQADDRARIVVVRGASACFSAGVDIKQHNTEEMPDLLPVFHEVFHSLLNLSAITVAAVEGHCLGGGAELAFACDRVVADSSARFGFPEIRIGCYPPVALALLPYRAGPSRAVELILGGDEVPLERLVAWGMVDHVANAGLDAGLEVELGHYTDKSPTVVGLAAGLLHQEGRRAWGDRISGYEQEYLDVLLPHPDVAEGIAAFLEKRKPNWAPPDPLVSADDELL